MMSNRQTKKVAMRKSRAGAAVVEFAVTVPVLFVFLFATIEFGLANLMFHTTEAAAYEAARVAIVPGATAAEAEQAARAVLGTARIQVADVRINPANLATDTDTVAVTVTMNFRDNTTLIPFFMGNEPTIRTCELNREKTD